jgi:hypothetical protein
MDAELTYVDQTVLLGVDSFYVSFLNAYAYNFTGGIYELIISNRSSTLLKSVDINISFEENPLNICPYRPAKTIHYEGLNLQPNASALLIFDQINATFQPKIPDQFCFWISNPNHTPDAVPGNDIYCETFNHVATLEPQADMFTLAPNPANTAVRVTFQEPAKTGSWKVLDLLGRQMTSGAVEQGSMALEIPTSELPAGMYSLWVNGRSVKVAVAH